MPQKDIDTYVNLSLRPFRKPNGDFIMVGSDGTEYELSSDNLTTALNAYYKKTQTYSSGQIDSFFDNYYTKTESGNLFIVAGVENPGPVIISDGGYLTVRTEDTGHAVYYDDGVNVYNSNLRADGMEVHTEDTSSGYKETSWIVSNTSTSAAAFSTDSTGAFKLKNGTQYVHTISTDGTLVSNSDSLLVTEKAIKTYITSIALGGTPLTSAGGNFDIVGDLTFSTGGTRIDGSSPTEFTFSSGTSASDFTLNFENTDAVQLSTILIQPTAISLYNASAVLMLSVTEPLATFSGGIAADSINLSATETVSAISSSTFPVTGESLILPTQAGVRSHVEQTSVSLISGGTISNSSRYTTIDELGLIVSDGADDTHLDEDSLTITAATSSGDVFVTNVVTDAVTGTAWKIDADGNFGLRTGATVNEISTDGTLSGDSDLSIPTEKAVKTYVDLFSTIDVNSVAGSTFTVATSSGEVYVGADTASSAFTVELPVGANEGLRVWVKDEDDNASNFNITVDGNGTNIDGSSTYVMSADGASNMFILAGGQWRVF